MPNHKGEQDRKPRPFEPREGTGTRKGKANSSSLTYVIGIIKKWLPAQEIKKGSATRPYDTEDNLTSITDANSNQTQFTYDAFGRVTKTTFPSTLAETYQYDADNNLTQKTAGGPAFKRF